jgi:hypothetical protein
MCRNFPLGRSKNILETDVKNPLRCENFTSGRELTM